MKSPELFIIGDKAKVVFSEFDAPKFFLREIWDFEKRLSNAEYRPSKNGKFNINSMISIKDPNLGVHAHYYPEKSCKCREIHYCLTHTTPNENESAPEFKQHKRQVSHNRFESLLPKSIKVIK